MNGRVAKKIRKIVYADLSLRDRKYGVKEIDVNRIVEDIKKVDTKTKKVTTIQRVVKNLKSIANSVKRSTVRSIKYKAYQIVCDPKRYQYKEYKRLYRTGLAKV